VSTPPAHHLFHPAHADAYVDTMRLGVDHLAEALRGTTRATTGRAPGDAARRVAGIDLDAPLGDPAEALAEMSSLYLDDAVWFHDPSYAAHLNCPVVLPALLAELFVSGVNSSLDTFDQSVGGTFVERHLVDWTAARIGFDHDADGVFTSGGTQSNLQGMLLARDHALAGRARGDASRLRILASADAHFSVQKSARLLGLGDAAVVAVATGDDRRMDVDALRRGLGEVVAAGLVPMAVVATAGTTDFGAIDPLRPIADLCHLHATWLHVDAAYGGGLLASRRLRHRLAGIERADSVTVDFHKTWFQPVSSSALLVRDGRHLGHVTWHADYLNPKDAAHPNQVDKSLQTTRRFDALKLWLTLRVMGPDAIGEYVEHVVDLATTVHARIDAHPDLEVAAPPQLSTIVFRYRPAGLPDETADQLVGRIRSRLYDSGEAMVAATRADGRRWLKLTLLNPMATAEDLARVTDAVVAAGRALEAELATGPVVGSRIEAVAS
jgi:L-2,4-diaminobutyrate decarboxylase